MSARKAGEMWRTGWRGPRRVRRAETGEGAAGCGAAGARVRGLGEMGRRCVAAGGGPIEVMADEVAGVLARSGWGYAWGRVRREEGGGGRIVVRRTNFEGCP